jgi:hypothetical protein
LSTKPLYTQHLFHCNICDRCNPHHQRVDNPFWNVYTAEPVLTKPRPRRLHPVSSVVRSEL